jgi:hypothetical protein
MYFGAYDPTVHAGTTDRLVAVAHLSDVSFERRLARDEFRNRVEVHLRAPRYGEQPSMTLARRGLPNEAASEASAWRRLAGKQGFEPR